MTSPVRQQGWLLPWLALAAPLLLLLALLALAQRRGANRVVAVPSLLIGSGLLVTNALAHGRRRRRLLAALRQPEIGR